MPAKHVGIRELYYDFNNVCLLHGFFSLPRNIFRKPLFWKETVQKCTLQSHREFTFSALLNTHTHTHRNTNQNHVYSDAHNRAVNIVSFYSAN